MADLRPMGVGEILDGALTIYRRHFIPFVAPGVLVWGLPSALTISAQLSGPQQPPVILSLAALMQSFAGLLLTAGVIRVISDFYLGREASLAQALALGAQKVWPLFVVGLGKAVVTGLVLIVPGFLAATAFPLLAKTGGLGALVAIALIGGAAWLATFVACGYGVTTQVVVLEPLGSSFDAFGRSWDLTRDRKLKVLGLALVAFILVAVPSVGIGALAAALRFSTSSWASVLLVLAAVLPLILTPVLPCVFTLMYYDLRVRREAFDLELLSQHLGAG